MQITIQSPSHNQNQIWNWSQIAKVLYIILAIIVPAYSKNCVIKIMDNTALLIPKFNEWDSCSHEDEQLFTFSSKKVQLHKQH